MGARDVRLAATPRGDVAYRRAGEGPAALFVHGFLLNGSFWSDVAAQVDDLRTCVSVDLPAHGGTRLRPEHPLGLEAQADVLAAVCDALDLEQVDLVGNDSGGAISQLFAVRHPERVRSLTLTNCDVHTNCPPAEFVATAETILAVGVRPILEQSLADPDFVRSERGLGIGWQDPQGLTDAAIRAFVEPLLEDPEGPATLERWLREFDGEVLAASEAALRSLDVPALIVWGDDDPLFPIEWAHWLRDALPGAKDVVELDGGKLYFPQEHPDALAGPLRSFWSGTTAGRSEEGMADAAAR